MDAPSGKVSSMKSMFEKPKINEHESSAPPPRRRQLRGNDWANGNCVTGARFCFLLSVSFCVIVYTVLFYLLCSCYS